MAAMSPAAVAAGTPLSSTATLPPFEVAAIVVLDPLALEVLAPLELGDGAGLSPELPGTTELQNTDAGSVFVDLDALAAAKAPDPHSIPQPWRIARTWTHPCDFDRKKVADTQPCLFQDCKLQEPEPAPESPSPTLPSREVREQTSSAPTLQELSRLVGAKNAEIARLQACLAEHQEAEIARLQRQLAERQETEIARLRSHIAEQQARPEPPADAGLEAVPCPGLGATRASTGGCGTPRATPRELRRHQEDAGHWLRQAFDGEAPPMPGSPGGCRRTPRSSDNGGTGEWMPSSPQGPCPRRKVAPSPLQGADKSSGKDTQHPAWA